MKRTFLLLPALLLGLFLLAGQASAAEEYAVQNIQIDSSQVSASVTAEKDCTLVAALYSQEGTLLESGTASVSAKSIKKPTVTLDLTRSDAYEVKAFLVETGTAELLCHYAFRYLQDNNDCYAVRSEDGKVLTF